MENIRFSNVLAICCYELSNFWVLYAHKEEIDRILFHRQSETIGQCEGISDLPGSIFCQSLIAKLLFDKKYLTRQIISVTCILYQTIVDDDDCLSIGLQIRFIIWA